MEVEVGYPLMRGKFEVVLHKVIQDLKEKVKRVYVDKKERN